MDELSKTEVEETSEITKHYEEADEKTPESVDEANGADSLSLTEGSANEADNPAPTEKGEKEKKKRRAWIIIALCVCILLCIAHSCSSSDSTGSSSSSSGWDKNSETNAKICAVEVVKANLKSPSTADFCHYYEMTATSLGHYQWKIEGYVDAQNSFGATLREEWIVVLTLTNTGYKDASVSFY